MTYHNQLAEDATSTATSLNIKWGNSSWHNDACGSILCDIDASAETYVQLFAFEDEEDMKAEGFEDLFAVVTYEQGEVTKEWQGNDRKQALAIANAYALALLNNLNKAKEEGFEHDGIWIADKMKSPCGRFDLTEEESIKLYGNR